MGSRIGFASTLGRLLGVWLVGAGTLPCVCDEPVRSALFGPTQLAEVDAQSLADLGCDSWALAVTESWEPSEAERQRLVQLGRENLPLSLWIEVGRDVALADRHPEWMASIQGHPEWRRFFPDFPAIAADQVVKVYPWVPIGYQEAFEAQLAKVKRILAQWPYVERVFLNDLQGAPSACGCGHPLCRWTTDYGPIKTATVLGPDAAKRFVDRVREIRPGLEVIPVWASECEEGDKPGLCAGVGCYRGACWREWSAQLEPLAEVSPRVGALLLEETFQRGELGPGWLGVIPKSFIEMPQRYQRSGVSADRLVAVIEGWPRGEKTRSIEEQLALLTQAGVGSYLISMMPIEQSWEPRVWNLPE